MEEKEEWARRGEARRLAAEGRRKGAKKTLKIRINLKIFAQTTVRNPLTFTTLTKTRKIINLKKLKTHDFLI